MGSQGVKLTVFQEVKGWAYRVPGGQGEGLQGLIGSRGTGSQGVKG